MSDTWRGMGMILRGEEIITVLYEALVNCNPLGAWRLNGLNTETETVPNDGTGAFSGDMILAAGNAPTTHVGPDGLTYPELGRDVPSDADHCFAYADMDFDAYADGMSVVVVYMPLTPGGAVADDGFIFMRRESPSVEASESMSLLSLSRYCGTTTTSAGAVANQVFKNFSAGVMYANGQWNILEIYFPPGDTNPVLYQNGVLLSSGITTINTGVRFDRGTLQPIFLASNDEAADVDSACANGYYAMCAVFEGTISDLCRGEYMDAAIAEGWLSDPAEAEVLFINATDVDGETTVGSFNNVLIKVSGTMSFFSGGLGDADVQFGSLPPGHAGIFTIKIAGVWTHVECIGGPYSGQQPNNTYWFEYDGGGSPIQMRIGDSFHGDNSGGFNVTVYPVA